MKIETEILLKEYKEEFKSYKNYLDNNNWFDDIREDKSGNLISNKLNTEISIVSTILTSMTKFKDDVGDDVNLKSVKDFISYSIDIVKKHVTRIDRYKKMFPLDETSGEKEVKFQSNLFSKKTSTKVQLTKLNIDENETSKKSMNLFFGNTKAPLLMREFLCESIPVIDQKTKLTEIDFNVPSVNPATSKEMLINMRARDIPKWDVTKHFFEQEKSTIQFWEEEIRKIKNGVNINGYFVHPWLYWHLNIFMLAYGSGDDKRPKNPLFRDNEYFFTEMLKRAEDDGRKGVLMYGSRRISKSVTMTSYLQRILYTVRNAKCTVLGFSEVPDLKAIVDYMNESITNLNPALRINANNLNLKEGITLGLKKTQQDRLDFSDLTFVNLEAGSKKGSQKPAASTPDAFVFDEIAKGECIKPFVAAKPSFADSSRGGKWRLVPLLAGTAGESNLSKDAELILKNPQVYDLLPMDWDLLEDKIDPEFVTWKRQNFGLFVPAQLSAEAPDKIITNFSDFLGIENEGLEKMEMHVTDWQAAKEFFESKREQVANDINALASYTNSFPMDVEDCYLTSEVNKFPGMLAKRRRRYIEDNGLLGKKVWFVNSGGHIDIQLSNDPIIEDYPFKGGNFDAPIVMLEDPYESSDSKPPLGLYCIGFDDVKHEKSDGDSVLSATVMKRSYEGGEWANRIVAYYDSRPDRKVDYYKNLYMLMKYYNARLLYENADTGFIEYMEDKHIEDVYTHISDGVGLATEENLQRNKNRRFGWAATPGNIYNLEQSIVVYTKEENVVIGEFDNLDGIDRINHPLLLEELYRYKKEGNYDRIRSFGLALKLTKYYDKTYSYMKSRKVERSEGDSYRVDKKSIMRDLKGLSNTSKLSKW